MRTAIYCMHCNIQFSSSRLNIEHLDLAFIFYNFALLQNITLSYCMNLHFTIFIFLLYLSYLHTTLYTSVGSCVQYTVNTGSVCSIQAWPFEQSHCHIALTPRVSSPQQHSPSSLMVITNILDVQAIQIGISISSVRVRCANVYLKACCSIGKKQLLDFNS